MDVELVGPILGILLILYLFYSILLLFFKIFLEIISKYWIDILIVSFGVGLAFYLGQIWPFVAAAFFGFLKFIISILKEFKRGKARQAEIERSEYRAWLIAKAESGLDDNAIMIAGMFLDGLSVTQDEDEGIRLLILVAEAGDIEAQQKIIKLFANGRGTPDIYADAVRRFRLMAVDWPAEELESLARDFEHGLQVPKDDSEANRWYRLAREVFRDRAEIGKAEPAERLAQYLKAGLGGAKDDVEALEWALVAARSGRKAAQELAGRLYCESDTIPTNYSEAVYWFRRASDQGEQRSKAYLVLLQDAGLGNPKNYEKEAKIYRQELEISLKNSQSSHSWWLTLVHGYEGDWLDNPDHEKAMYWLQIASDAGETYASEKLGDRYVEGLGVAKDLKKALEFYKTAVVQGSTKAAKKIAEIEQA